MSDARKAAAMHSPGLFDGDQPFSRRDPPPPGWADRPGSQGIRQAAAFTELASPDLRRKLGTLEKFLQATRAAYEGQTQLSAAYRAEKVQELTEHIATVNQIFAHLRAAFEPGKTDATGNDDRET